MSPKTFFVRITREFHAAPERVFDAWLDPEKVRAWMRMALVDGGLSGDMRRVEVDARVGGHFTFSDMRMGEEAVHWGTYLEIDRPQKLVFTWFTSKEDERENSSIVSISIVPNGNGCLLTLVHDMDMKWSEYKDLVTAGWTRMVDMQARVLAGDRGNLTGQ